MNPGLGYTLTLNPAHPSQMEIFAGPVSFLHVAAGFAAGLFPGFDVAALGAFTAYQIGQIPGGQSLQVTAGEILEFAIGLLLARFCGAAFLKAVR